MGRAALRPGPCLAPSPPVPPIHPTIPAARPPWRSDHRPSRHRDRRLSPPSGCSPQRLALPLLSSEHPFSPSPTALRSPLSPSLHRRSGTAPSSSTGIIGPTGPPSGSRRPVLNRCRGLQGTASSPVLPPGTPSCRAKPTSTSARAASRTGFPLQSPLRSDFRSNPSRLRSLTLAARSACQRRPSPPQPADRHTAAASSHAPTPRPITATAPLRRVPRPRWPNRSCTGPWPWSPLSGLCSHTRRTWGALIGTRALGCALRPFTFLPCALL